ncbi:MAG TPA: histidinol-phosphatase [Geminicoccaceae bacterium]|nr:histidinol-phosphatase [Geminicoccaceae bacterium]
MAAAAFAEFLPLAHAMADAAAAVQRRWFRTPFLIERKADLSPVTIADREAETAMAELIRRHHPDHGILGEEHGTTGRDAEFLWCLDPIDGTKSFVCGRPMFGTLIALLHQGRPVLGIIDQSILRERWVGLQGGSTTLNGTPIRVRDCAGLDEAVLFATSPQMFTRPGEAEAFRRVESTVRLTLFGGDCYGYGLLAAGFADLAVEAGLQTYDFMALIPVIEGAGGRLTDWQGRALGLDSAGQVIAAGDARAHEAALRRLDLS